MRILNNGDVSFCCGDYMGELSVGNINNEGIEAIWARGGKLREDFLMRLQREYPTCSKCELFDADQFNGVSIDNLTIEEFRKSGK